MNIQRCSRFFIAIFCAFIGGFSNAQVFSSNSGDYRVGNSWVSVDTGSKSRIHDFGPKGGFVDPTTGAPRVGTIISGIGYGKSIVLSGASISNKGVPGRVYWQPTGVVTLIKAGEGKIGEPCRAQVSSFPVTPDVRLRWVLRFTAGDSALGQEWSLTPYGTDPALIWQLKAPNLRPSLAMILDTDDSDDKKLMLYFSQLAGSMVKVQRAGTVRGLTPESSINVVIETRLDEREIADGGEGYWRVWVNGLIAVDRVGPTLSQNAVDPHQWFFGMYRYLTNCPTGVARYIIWEDVRLERVDG